MTIKDAEKKFISIGEASIYTGLSQDTLRRYFKRGAIQGFISAGGQRRFEIKSLESLCARNTESNMDSQEIDKITKINFLYARVSSKKQEDDLQRQISFLQEKVKQTGKNIDDYKLISDIGSGINFNKKGINILLDHAMSRTIGEVIVANRDRLSRFGFDLIKSIIKKGGGELTVLNDTQTKTSEQELAEDLLSIVHIFSCKQMGKRSYKNRKCTNKNTEIENLPK